MASAVIPMVHGEIAKLGRLRSAIVVYSLGSTVGGATTGLLLAMMVGEAPGLPHGVSSRITLVVGGISVIYGAHELGVIRLPAFRIHRQVPRSWIARFPPVVWTFLFGFCLGTGLGAQMPVVTYYLVVLLILAAKPNIVAAVGVMALFGLARSLPLFILSLRPQWRKRRLELMHWGGMVKLINGLNLVFWGVLVSVGAR